MYKFYTCEFYCLVTRCCLCQLPSRLKVLRASVPRCSARAPPVRGPYDGQRRPKTSRLLGSCASAYLLLIPWCFCGIYDFWYEFKCPCFLLYLVVTLLFHFCVSRGDQHPFTIGFLLHFHPIVQVGNGSSSRLIFGRPEDLFLAGMLVFLCAFCKERFIAIFSLSFPVFWSLV